MLQRILSNFLMGIYLLFMLFIGLLMPVVFYFATIKGGVLLFDGHGFMETWGFLGGIVLVMLITNFLRPSPRFTPSTFTAMTKALACYISSFLPVEHYRC